MRSAALTLLLLGCGGPPALPPVEPPPSIAPTGDADAGRALFADRGFGRSGFACADCHPGPSRGVRPAPSLSPWAGGEARFGGRPTTPAEALAACVERFQDRGPPSPTEAAALRAAVEPAPVAMPDDPAALYRSACQHCHEGGPAPAVVGRRWSPSGLRARLRRRPGLDEHMPAFDPAVVPDPALDALIGWLAARPPRLGSGRLSPSIAISSERP